jgi:hypothetical protein
LPNDYCTSTEAKALMPDQSWSTAYDALLSSLATQASREFDRYTNRPPGSYYVTTASDRYFTGDGSLCLYPGEMAAAPTAVAVAETGVLTTYTAWSTASDYQCLPYNAMDEGRPYDALFIDLTNGNKTYWPPFAKSIKVTAKWGYSAAVPEDITGACLTMVIRHFKRGQQGMADVGAIAELGQLRYVKGQDPAVDDLIEHLRRQAI